MSVDTPAIARTFLRELHRRRSTLSANPASVEHTSSFVTTNLREYAGGVNYGDSCNTGNS